MPRQDVFDILDPIEDLPEPTIEDLEGYEDQLSPPNQVWHLTNVRRVEP